ncbi:MAG: HlyC/CorC family transporter [Oscillospiraceae bacterium]|nr:HlyC/CorC family transporter [Oscillospiraceae bacterium]
MTVFLVGAGILLCLVFSAFFSASEMAYSSCNALRLENLEEEGSRPAKTARFITGHFDFALSTILIGNNLVNIAGSSLASVLLLLALGTQKGEKYAWIATAVMTVLVILFGETIPKITAKKNANRFALRFAYLVRGLMVVFAPLVWVVLLLVRLISIPFRGEAQEEDPEAAVEELQNIIETAEDEAVLDEDRSELVRSAIDFSEIMASEVMTARVDLVALDIEDSWDDLLEKIEQSPYSRLPVYEGSIDNIIGVLYLNRFLKAMTENRHTEMRSFLMPPVFVYKTMKLPDVLNRLRKEKQHLAIVSDEYGGTLGVVSMEDVLEQIVGEIWDETDQVEQEVVQRTENEFEVDGDMTISDFLELTGIHEEDFEAESETVGGWTVERFGEFPRVGDHFSYENLTVTVLAMDGRRVEKVLVRLDNGQDQDKETRNGKP